MGLVIMIWSFLVVAAAIGLAVRLKPGLVRKLNNGQVTGDPEGRFDVMTIKKEFLATIRNSLSIPTAKYPSPPHEQCLRVTNFGVMYNK
jgi:hypothetical protein